MFSDHIKSLLELEASEIENLHMDVHFFLLGEKVAEASEVKEDLIAFFKELEIPDDAHPELLKETEKMWDEVASVDNATRITNMISTWDDDSFHVLERVKSNLMSFMYALQVNSFAEEDIEPILEVVEEIDELAIEAEINPGSLGEYSDSVTALIEEAQSILKNYS